MLPGRCSSRTIQQQPSIRSKPTCRWRLRWARHAVRHSGCKLARGKRLQFVLPSLRAAMFRVPRPLALHPALHSNIAAATRAGCGWEVCGGAARNRAAGVRRPAAPVRIRCAPRCLIRAVTLSVACGVVHANCPRRSGQLHLVQLARDARSVAGSTSRPGQPRVGTLHYAVTAAGWFALSPFLSFRAARGAARSLGRCP